MAFLFSEEKIIEYCDDCGLEFIERFFDGIKRHTYVRIKCKKHNYKGEQVLDVDCLKRWAVKKKCLCDVTNRDLEDLRRMPTLPQNIEVLDDIPYVNSATKIKCRCKQCNNEWLVTPNHLQGGRGCPVCKHIIAKERLLFTNEHFSDRLKKAQDTLVLVGKYNGMNRFVEYKCLKCGYIGTAKAWNLLSLDAGCRRCRSSVGERKVDEWLKNNKIDYISQHVFLECKDVHPLRFDFYLPSLNTCIEYQGEQHYRPVRFRNGNEVDINLDFKNLQRRDSIKREFCTANGINLIEVPYWEINHIDEYLTQYIQ